MRAAPLCTPSSSGHNVLGASAVQSTDSGKAPAKAQEPRGWAQGEASPEKQGFPPRLGWWGNSNCISFSRETAGKEPGLLSGLR